MTGNTSRRRGRQRELAVVHQCRKEGAVAYRVDGAADIIVLRRGLPPALVQVKSTAGGPYAHFSPADRAILLNEADKAGATAWLCWWPSGGKAQWIPSEKWPQ